MGYRATRDEEGVMTIHHVPIFCTCERAEIVFDDAWIAEAVAKAKQGEREGYYPPLHVRHHEPSTELNDSVRPAGYFRVTGAGPITLRGVRRTAIFADLVITNPAVQADVMSRLLPYRSVEIFDVENPSINGLALLDHEAPFLELPMLMVSDVDEVSTDVSGVTFCSSWRMDAVRTDSPVVACFRRGKRAQLLFREGEQMDLENSDDPKNSEGQNFADGDTSDNTPPDGGDSGGGSLDVTSVVKAIESGEISVKDMDAILAAIQSQMTESDVAEPDATPAPAAAPGAESMKADQRFAAMSGEIAALRAKDKARDEADKRKEDVAAALIKLDGRPLGSDLETRLVKFHLDHGPAAFRVYVDTIADTFGAVSCDGIAAEAFCGQASKAPEVALKYQAAGTDAIDKAAVFCAEWAQLKEMGLARMSEETYVAINMRKIGVEPPKQKAAS